LSAVLASALAGKPAVVMSRLSLNWYQRDWWFFRGLECAVLHRRVNLAIGNSNAILWELHQEGISDEKMVLIHNGIDANDFRRTMVDRETARRRLGLPQDALVFSAVANLFAYKGHADLLQALASIRDRLPANWFLLAAGGDRNGNLARLSRMADEIGLTPHVRFLGQRRDVAAILSSADIHVSASHHEGFPNNILEAMCVGLPVIATAVGGVLEQVADELTGHLVPPHDPASLAEALLLLARDRTRRLAMGRAARQRVEMHFPIERSVAAFADTYARAAGMRSGRR
jgi:glycosyltransferase involved in cell wall biosynthesis